MILQDGFERTHIRCYEDEKTKKPAGEASGGGGDLLEQADARGHVISCGETAGAKHHRARTMAAELCL